jgi:RNA polymerase sigma factor (sigma-70 family)
MTDFIGEFRELVRQASEGSDEAAWRLVEQYGEALHRAVRRSLSKQLRSKFDSLDFVQLVWGSLFRVRGNLTRFNRPEELAAYLLTMARNKVGLEIRRRLMTEKYDVRRERGLDPSDEQKYADRSHRQPLPEDVAIAREQWNRMLDDQPEHYRKIVELRLQGHTYQAIADTLHIDECTVRRFLKRLLQEAVT